MVNKEENTMLCLKVYKIELKISEDIIIGREHLKLKE